MASLSPSAESLSAALLETAAQFGLQALAIDDPATLIQQAAELVASALEVPASGFLELTPDGRTLLSASVGWPRPQGGTALDLTDDVTAAHVIRLQAPLLIRDLTCDERFPSADLLRQHDVRSSLQAPVMGRRRPLGVLAAYSHDVRTFTSAEAAWLQLLANALSAPLERKWDSLQDHDPKLLRAEQMMAIGQVAAGVAHELRNPLTSIKGLVQVNVQDWERQGLPTDDLAIIEHEIRRMEKTLQTFLDFARPPEPARRSTDLVALVEQVLSLVRGRARKQQVSVKFQRPAEGVWLEIDPDQIKQLLLNLILNALDAMTHGGQVEVDLQPPADGFVSLFVRDSGPGIARHILPKVFETFVSSKETGVGLGLPLSRRIAEEHGGNLTAYNLPQAGACFVLRLAAQ